MRQVMPRREHLKFQGVTARTRRLYKKEVARFIEFVEKELGALPTEAETLDEQMGEYINMLFQEGESISHAGWLLSGFKRFMPRVKRDLVVSQQFYNNWNRHHVPFRAVPMPWNICKALAALAHEAKQTEVALLLLVGYVFYLRSMEMLNLQKADIIFDLRHGTCFVTLKDTKTSRNMVQHLALHNASLTGVLYNLWDDLPAGKLWPYSVHVFRKCFNLLLSTLGATPLNFTLYSIRRGGATHAYVRSRNLDTVVIQGRWKDSRTARIYLDDARASMLRLAFPVQLQEILARYAKYWCDK